MALQNLSLQGFLKGLKGNDNLLNKDRALKTCLNRWKKKGKKYNKN